MRCSVPVCRCAGVPVCRCEVEGMREDEGERKRGCGGGVSKRSTFFFSSSFLWLSTVFIFFGVEMQVEKPCQLVSSCFFIFLQIKKSLASSNLEVATGGTSRKYTKPKKLGRKLSTWHKYCQVRTWQPSSNLALGTNLARTWQ